MVHDLFLWLNFRRMISVLVTSARTKRLGEILLRDAAIVAIEARGRKGAAVITSR